MAGDAIPFSPEHAPDGRASLHELLEQAFRASPVSLVAVPPEKLMRGAGGRLDSHAPRFLALLESLDPERVADESARLLEDWIEGTDERRGTP